MAPALVLYGIANCDTVKKARAWFTAQGCEYEFHDFKRAGLPEALLDDWIAALGVPVLVNRRGTTWRRLDDAQRAAADDPSQARALLLAQPSLVKRPVMRWPDGSLSVGFDPERFAVALAKTAR
ncbi:MAG TPA: ArsC family reductase [Burkholderiaceae bacterium]|nr:ArsC family reductase [Burkholderiaceae bacterium]